MTEPDFSRLPDLLSPRLGGRVLWANDDFFAPKENLIKLAPAVFVPLKYTARGKWMDGWESRRRRRPGHDRCILQLGLRGRLVGINVDTSHFLGNFPQAYSLDAIDVPAEMAVDRLIENSAWLELIPRTPLAGGSDHLLAIDEARSFSHLRLHIYPDGGVARLRAFGQPSPDWRQLVESGDEIDLIAVQFGGQAVAASDDFFSRPANLLQPGRGADMGDGWETRRRRGPGFDWAIIALGRRGIPRRALIDTRHFKGNYPDSCQLEGVDLGDPGAMLDPDDSELDWRQLVPRQALAADHEHCFEIDSPTPLTHLRLSIYPDGGVSRLRLLGTFV